MDHKTLTCASLTSPFISYNNTINQTGMEAEGHTTKYWENKGPEERGVLKKWLLTRRKRKERDSDPGGGAFTAAAARNTDSSWLLLMSQTHHHHRYNSSPLLLRVTLTGRAKITGSNINKHKLPETITHLQVFTLPRLARALSYDIISTWLTGRETV